MQTDRGSWMRVRSCRFLTAVRHGSAREEGQALIEYALILGLVAVLTVGVLQALGHNVSSILDRVSTTLSAVPNP
jgi:Flp pilus assembly pilin Flp